MNEKTSVHSLWMEISDIKSPLIIPVTSHSLFSLSLFFFSISPSFSLTLFVCLSLSLCPFKYLSICLNLFFYFSVSVCLFLSLTHSFSLSLSLYSFISYLVVKCPLLLPHILPFQNNQLISSIWPYLRVSLLVQKSYFWIYLFLLK